MTARSSNSELQTARVELGRVVGAHALAGEIRVRWFGDGPDHLASAESIWLGESGSDPSACAYRVLAAGSGRRGEVRLGLEGVVDRTAAEALRGQLAMVDAVDLAPLSDDEFYWHELIGFRVETLEGEAVGEVLEIWETGGHDLLVIRGVAGQQLLVPTAREIMQKVDRPGRRIVIDAIPGLIDGAE